MLQLFRILALSCLVTMFMLSGCKKETDSSDANGTGVHSTDDDHDHDHDHGDDHDHDDHDHGDAHSLGSLTIGGATLEVSISGEVEPNGELHIDVVHTGGPMPAAVRFWIGVESGAGSLKGKADAHDHEFHGHAEVPAQIATDAALWIEVETASGQRVSGSVALP